jgi:predicted Zn-dependent peptidase
MENYKIKATKSGLKTLVIKRPKNPTRININLVIGIGSDLEYGKYLELGHFLEHLFVSLTSTKYPNSKANRELFSTNSIGFSASVGTKNTMYEFSLDKSQLYMFLDILVHGIFDFKVDKEIFENEKNSILEELNELIDDISYPLETHTDTMIYKHNYREIPQKMRLANTRRMNPSDVQNYWSRFYRLPYMVLAIYGSVDINTLVDKIDKLSYGIVGKNMVKHLHNHQNLTHLYKEFSLNNESRILFTKKMDNISTIKINWRIDMNAFSDDYYKLYCIDNLLISDLNSLLLKKLRGDEGLIYDIESHFSIDEFQNNLSFYFFQTTVASRKVLKVIESFMEVIDYITNNKIKVKNYEKFLNNQKHIMLERNEMLDYSDILTNYAKYVLYNKKILTQKHEDKKYVEVSREDIIVTAKKIFNTNNLYISYANEKNISKEIDAIVTKQNF